MTALARAAFAMLSAIALGAAAPRVGAPVEIAAVNARCNGLVSSELERRIRTDDRTHFANSLGALNDRERELDSLLQQAQLESDILHNVCSDAELAQYQDELVGSIAWAYALEADISPQRYTLLRCPQTAARAPQALLASAWYAIATTLVPVDPSDPSTAPTPAPLVREVMPKVQSRAAVAHLALPAPLQATQYWRDGILSQVPSCTPPTP